MILRIEGISDPVWSERAKMMAELATSPLTPDELFKKAFATYRWVSNLAGNVLAAADGKTVFFVRGKWMNRRLYDELVSSGQVRR